MLESGKMGNVSEDYANHEMKSGPVVLCHYSIPTVELSDSHAVLAPVPILEKQPRVEKVDVKEEGYTSGEADKKK